MEAKRLDLVQLFFASTGRMGRGVFLFAIAAVFAVFAVYEAAVVGVAHAATGWLVHLVLLAAAASVLSKRLHDRGRSGWWSAPILFAFAVVWPEPEGAIDWAFSAVLVWGVVELALMPGRPEPNRFGPPWREGPEP